MSYDDHLDRAMERAPDIAEGGDRFQVPDPELRTEGNVTVFENFPAVVDRLDREPKHVMQFLQSELGTSAAIDETGRLRLTGEFKQRRVADAVDEYVAGYVRCEECGLPDTRLITERGAVVRKCDACGALSPVPDS